MHALHAVIHLLQQIGELAMINIRVVRMSFQVLRMAFQFLDGLGFEIGVPEKIENLQDTGECGAAVPL